MSEKPGRKSHKLAWTLWIVAVPVLYLLTLPWVLGAFWKSGYKPGKNDTGKAFDMYCAPWHWLHENTRLSGPLWAYYMWCWRIAGIEIEDIKFYDDGHIRD